MLRIKNSDELEDGNYLLCFADDQDLFKKIGQFMEEDFPLRARKIKTGIIIDSDSTGEWVSQIGFRRIKGEDSCVAFTTKMHIVFDAVTLDYVDACEYCDHSDDCEMKDDLKSAIGKEYLPFVEFWMDVGNGKYTSVGCFVVKYLY